VTVTPRSTTLTRDEESTVNGGFPGPRPKTTALLRNKTRNSFAINNGLSDKNRRSAVSRGLFLCARHPAAAGFPLGMTVHELRK
jgi:hypothetical protein